MSRGARGYVCPACREPVEQTESTFTCVSCRNKYPILFGIPDFRLWGDQYLSLQEERAKAAKLHDFGRAHSLRELVGYYYSITDDVPADLEPQFASYVLNAEARSLAALKALAPTGGPSLLDLGCGSGGSLVAGEGLFNDRIGVDIALRWLVIAQKRLEECGSSATLVCADAEALPFERDTFSHVLASDLLENTRSPSATIGSACSVLETCGRIYISSSNGRWVGPHPATGVWAAGFIPKALRVTLMQRRHGIDILRAVSFIDPGSVRRIARGVGLRQVEATPLQPEMGQLASRSALFRLLARTYSVLATAPLLRTVLLHAGPVFQAIFVKEAST